MADFEKHLLPQPVDPAALLLDAIVNHFNAEFPE